MHTWNSQPDAAVSFQLSLQPVRYTIRCLAVALGGTFILSGLVLAVSLGYGLVLAALNIWIGLLFVCLGTHSPTQRISRSPNSCVVSCLSLCFSCIDFHWEISDLEKRIRLNREIKGTLFSDLINLLASHGIQHHTFTCDSSSEMQQVLVSYGAPAIAIIHTPVLSRPDGWGIIFHPIKTIAHWLGFRNRSRPLHATLVHGVDGQDLLIYDPEFGTKHRVIWSRFSRWLAPEAFGGAPFLIVPRPMMEVTTY